MMRVPAHANWRARTLSWMPLEGTHAAACVPLVDQWPGLYEAAYGSDGKTIAYLRRIQNEVGYIAHGAPIEFIKLILPQHYEHQTRIACLEKTLAVMGVQVPVLKQCVPLTQGNHAFVYDWIKGIAPEGTVAHLTEIGRALAKLHAALVKVSDQFQMVTQTRVRLAHYKALAYDQCFDRYWQGSDVEDFVLKMRNEFLCSLETMSEEALPCHGDLNPGNMLMLRGGVAFLDFEDACHTVVWPGFDLAKVIERLILPHVHEGAIDINQATAYSQSLLSAYSAAAGAPSVRRDEVGRGRLATALRWHIGLAVLILSAPGTPKLLARAEVQKFIEIERIIHRFEIIL